MRLLRTDTTERRFLLTGHMDTVFPADHPFQAVTWLDEATLNGPGTADMKGGIAAFVTFHQHHPGRSDVQRQPQQGRNQNHRRKRRKLQRLEGVNHHQHRNWLFVAVERPRLGHVRDEAAVAPMRPTLLLPALLLGASGVRLHRPQLGEADPREAVNWAHRLMDAHLRFFRQHHVVLGRVWRGRRWSRPSIYRSWTQANC